MPDDYRNLVVLSLLLDNPSWGGETIRLQLEKEQICVINRKEAIRIGNEVKQYISKHHPKEEPVRYEFINVNDAWCADFKEFMLGEDKYYLFRVIDDKSRFEIGSSITKDATTAHVKHFIDAAIRYTGVKPRAIKTDGGPQFRVEFRQYCKENGIAHIKSIPYYPRCNAKIERVFLDVETKVSPRIEIDIQTEEELYTALKAESIERNFVRPHQSLDGLTPYEVYSGIGGKIKQGMDKLYESVTGVVRKVKNTFSRIAKVKEFIPGAKCDLAVMVK